MTESHMDGSDQEKGPVIGSLEDPAIYIDLSETTYDDASSIILHRVKEPFGGLLLMSSQFGVTIGEVKMRNGETFLQALQFTNRPEIQELLLSYRSPLLVKHVAVKHAKQGLGRQDWPDIELRAMDYVFRVRLAQNYDALRRLLYETCSRSIVEISPDPGPWGVKSEQPGDYSSVLRGKNWLGKLLEHQREEVRTRAKEELLTVPPLDISDFKLLGKQIETVTCPAQAKH